ncbi:DUF6385 domain-containing protein [Ethanoligenens harbinense]|uniref:DUF6385 domain-containing protein n=1 Tax=Ethanoligenens harbinense TaxID=253239 RepID=UPI0002EB6E09|nr:DUF6385 domain-containing protein [Ethanoligenens harbinense]
MAGSVTVGNAVTIANNSLTVAGSVTVGNAVTIANDSLTVAGSVTVGNAVTIANDSLTVAGSVTVGNAVTIANDTLTALISGYAFTSGSVAITTSTSSIAFDNLDISSIREGSFFVHNVGSTPFTVSLEISPIADDAYYAVDPSYASQLVGANANVLLAITKLGNYARVRYSLLGQNTFQVFYNVQGS